MASDVCIAVITVFVCSILLPACSGSDMTGIGLEFTHDPAEKNVAVPGSVVRLSCSTNLPVDITTWHLNHHPIPPQHVIHASDKEISEYLANFDATNCLNCEDPDGSFSHTSQLQQNIKMMMGNEMLVEGKYLEGSVNGTNYILVYLSHDEHEITNQLGIYQCLATLGTISLVSAPGRLELATLAACPSMAAENVSVAVGSAVRIPCRVPDSVPQAAVSFHKDGALITVHEAKFEVTPEGDLLLMSVSPEDAGEYSCTASNAVLRTSHTCPTSLHLNVVLTDGAAEQQPELISPKPGLVVASEGEDVMLSCVTSRGLANAVTWWTRSPATPHLDGGASNTSDIIATPAALTTAPGDVLLSYESAGSGRLRLAAVSPRHSGQYVCHAREGDTSQPPLSAAVQLYVRAAPRVVSGLQRMDVKEGERLEVSCVLTGEPAPLLIWLSNGRLLQPGSQYSMQPRGVLVMHSVSKRDAGVLQCFGHNAVGSVSSAALLTVIPTTVHAHPHTTELQDKPSWEPEPVSSEMLPFSRPTVARVADDTVRLHWQPSSSPVRFYKVQYRVLPQDGPPNSSSDAPHHELQAQAGSSHERHRWQTEGEHIPAERSSTLVSGLTPGSAYKFRVTAVLASYQQRVSPSSRRFLLRPMRPLRPPAHRPLITNVRWLQGSSGKQAELRWQYVGSANTDGFLISLRPANSSLPYAKRRFLGGERRSIVLTDVPASEGDMEVRVQAFNLAGPSPASLPGLLRVDHRITLPDRGEAASLPVTFEVSGGHTRLVDAERHALWSLGSQGSSEEMGSGQLGDSRSDESGSFSNESSYSNEGEDSDERRTGASSSGGGLSSTHLLGLLVFVLLALMAVVAISYGLYSQRKKRAGYGVPLEQLSVSTSEDHFSCSAAPQPQASTHSRRPQECAQPSNRDYYRADMPPSSLSQPD